MKLFFSIEPVWLMVLMAAVLLVIAVRSYVQQRAVPALVRTPGTNFMTGGMVALGMFGALALGLSLHLLQDQMASIVPTSAYTYIIIGTIAIKGVAAYVLAVAWSAGERRLAARILALPKAKLDVLMDRARIRLALRQQPQGA